MRFELLKLSGNAQIDGKYTQRVRAMKVSDFESLSVLVMRTYTVTTSLPEKQQFMTFPLILFSVFCLFEPLQREIVLLTPSAMLTVFIAPAFLPNSLECSFPNPYSDFLGVVSSRFIWIVFCIVA